MEPTLTETVYYSLNHFQLCENIFIHKIIHTHACLVNEYIGAMEMPFKSILPSSDGSEMYYIIFAFVLF